MNNQFKPGDLALVLGGIQVNPNTGKCVELVRCAVGPACLDVNGGTNWVDVPAGLKVWVVTGDGLIGEMTASGKTFHTLEHVFPERNLMPLRGDFQPERQQSREVPA